MVLAFAPFNPNIYRSRKLLDPKNDKIRLVALLNIPTNFGGVPLSNMYQHCKRGCTDPLTIWLKVWYILLVNYPEVCNIMATLLPCKVRASMDPFSLVEDIHGLNINRLPNYERKE